MKPKNRILNLVIAFVCSLAIWFFVVNNVNPIEGRTFSAVTVHYANLENLEARGLTLTERPKLKCDIKVTGKRGDIVKLRKSDLTASINFTGYTAKTTAIPIKVERIRGISISKISPSVVRLKIEKIITREINITPPNKNSAINPTAVEVVGAASLVEKVKRIIVQQGDEEGLLLAVDADGAEVEGISLSAEKVTVTKK